MRIWALLGLSLLAACHPNEVVSLPTLDGARSYIIAGFGPRGADAKQPLLQDSLQPRFAEAFDAGHAATFAHVRDDLSSIEMHAYPCGLAEMALEAGPLALSTTVRATERVLPDPIAAWSLPAGASQFSPTTSERSRSLDETINFWEVPSLCERAALRLLKENAYQEELGSIDTRFDIPLVAVEHPPGEVLVLTQNGRLFQVPRIGGAVSSTLAISKRTVGLTQAEDGAIWALDEGGSLHLVAADGTVTDFPGHAHVARANTATISMVGALGFVALDSGGSSDPNDLFAVADDRVLMQYEGSDWRTLLTSDLEGWKLTLSMDFVYTFPYLPRLIRRGPGSIVINGLSDEERKVVFWESGRARIVTISAASTVTALFDHPTYGLLAGDIDGNIFRYVEAEGLFVAFLSVPGAEAITIGGDEDSLWWSSFNQVHTYSPLAGLCGSRVRDAGVFAYPFHGEWVLGSLQLEEEVVWPVIDWVTEQAPATRCEGYRAP